MNENLVKSIKAAHIHKKISKELYSIVKPGMSLREIVLFIEDSIKTDPLIIDKNMINNGIAFPVGVSVNNCVAHYTPNSNDLNYQLIDTDIIKIDYGVHYEGNIIDSAFTLNFDNKYDDFIKHSRELTNYVVSISGVDVVLGEIGELVDEYVNGLEIELDNKTVPLQVMKDLCGHKIAPYIIHAGKAVPNTKILYPIRMQENEFYAIEPFLTTGNGKSIIKTPISHYAININYLNNPNPYKIKNKEDKETYEYIKQTYYSLPFCERWIPNKNLQNLVDKNIVQVYPPIYDIDNSLVSQFEHTIYIRDKGILKLTANDNY